jgi:hypothetical protein
LFWSDAELEYLQGNNIYHITKLMKKQIAVDFESIYQPIITSFPSLFGSVTISDYFWALSIVYSRSIEFSSEIENTTVRCIVPVLDMANHCPSSTNLLPCDTFFYNSSTESVQLVSSSPLKEGEECGAVYGLYPNSKLLLTYGFVLQDNPHRSIDLWTRLTPSVSNHEKKQAILAKHSLTAEQTYDFKGTIRPNYIAPALLATIRVIQATEEELEEELIERAFVGEMVSVRNEMASYTSLRNLIIARMKLENAEV